MISIPQSHHSSIFYYHFQSHFLYGYHYILAGLGSEKYDIIYYYHHILAGLRSEIYDIVYCYHHILAGLGPEIYAFV